MLLDTKKVRLSKNFTLDEFLKTSSKFDNIPSGTIINNLQYLVDNQLQPFRSYIDKPIKITSGFRSEEVNKDIGGVKTSQHKIGQAADWKIEGLEPEYVFQNFIASGVPFDQAILEFEGKKWWIHSSLKKSNDRNQTLLAVHNYVTGKKDYSSWTS